MHWRNKVRTPEAGATQGGGGGTGTSTERQSGLNEGAVERLIASLGGGNANTAIAELLKENREYRERHRQDQETIAGLNKKGLKDGEVVISKEDNELLTHVKGKKLTIELLNKQETELGELRGFKAESEFDKLIRQASDALGYNFEVLADQVKLRKLHIEMKEVTTTDPLDNTKKIKQMVPHVRPAGDEKAGLVPLEEYVDDKLKTYKVALTTKASSEEDGTKEEKTSTAIPFPKQRAGDRAPSTDVAATYIGQQYDNPFAKAGEKK